MDTPMGASGGSDDTFELVARAATGDRAAAGAYFQKNHRLLMAMARRIGGGVLDPDDLLSDAMITILAKWSEGNGPDRYANAYVIQTMRNKVKDELKSPRSNVVEITELTSPTQEDSAKQHAADMHWEYAIVRRALDLLPTDQRAVLVATVIDGSKPADLEEELRRPASAIYSLSRRARVGLRRATLRVVLEERAPEECRVAATELPETVQAAVEHTSDSRGMDHIRTCPRCRAAWARFGAMSSTLGIVSLLTVSGVMLPAPSAHATEASAERVADQRERSATPRGGDEQDPRWQATMMRAGAAAVAAGAVVIGAGFLTNPAWQSGPPEARFDVTSAQSEDQSVLDVRIFVDRPWTVDQLTITLSPTVFVDHAPPGWTCTAANRSSTRCVTSIPSATGGEFVVSGVGRTEGGTYRVELTAHVDGHALTAYETGPLQN